MIVSSSIRNTTRGLCMVNYKKQLLWVDIPKNASKSISKPLINNKDWEVADFTKINVLRNYTAVAAIRDPLTRWIGCTLELCAHRILHHKSFEGFEEWFMHRNFVDFEINLDLHHRPQCDFLAGLLNLKLYLMDCHNFSKNICAALNILGPLPHINATKESDIKNYAKPYVDSILTEALKDKIKDLINKKNSSSKNTNGPDQNFGVGLKVAALPRNQYGLIVMCRTKERPKGFMIWLCYDFDHNENLIAGTKALTSLEQWNDYNDGTISELVPNDLIDFQEVQDAHYDSFTFHGIDWMSWWDANSKNETGTAVILCGNKEDENTLNHLISDGRSFLQSRFLSYENLVVL